MSPAGQMAGGRQTSQTGSDDRYSHGPMVTVGAPFSQKVQTSGKVEWCDGGLFPF